MRIIGKTEKGFLLEATEDEVANLLGYYGSYSLPKREYYHSCEKLRIGDEVNIAAMFKHLYGLASESREIVMTVAKLRAAADLIGTLPNPLTAVVAKPDVEITP